VKQVFLLACGDGAGLHSNPVSGAALEGRNLCR